MYDVDKRLRYLKIMQKGKIPEEYRHDGDTGGYRTEYERYNAIYEEIEKCDDQELGNLEVLLESGLEESKRFREFSSIVPLAMSMIALGFTIAIQFAIAIMQTADQGALLVGDGENLFTWVMLLLMIGVLAFLGIYIYMYLKGSKVINQNLYLLGVLKKIKGKRGIA